MCMGGHHAVITLAGQVPIQHAQPVHGNMSRAVRSTVQWFYVCASSKNGTLHNHLARS